MFTLSRLPGLAAARIAGPARSIAASAPALARQKRAAPPALSKKKLQAKERKRELKHAAKRRSVYDSEKMPLAGAIQVLRAVEVGRPSATLELVVRTRLARAARGRIALPHAPGPARAERVLVFAEGRAADAARAAGAAAVGGAELADAVVAGRLHASLVLATPGLARAIAAKLGRVLGPRGMMPTVRRGTVTEDPAAFIRRLGASREWRGDKAGTVRTAIGRVDFAVEDVVQNVRHFVEAVKKEAGVGGGGSDRKSASVIRRVVLSSPQGPGITISDVV